MSEKPKPCPFCGATPELIEAMGEGWVKCYVCGTSCAMCRRPEDAVELWNRRAEGFVVRELSATKDSGFILTHEPDIHTMTLKECEAEVGAFEYHSENDYGSFENLRYINFSAASAWYKPGEIVAMARLAVLCKRFLEEE